MYLVFQTIHVVEISVATPMFPNSDNSLNESILPMLSEVTGSDKSGWWSLNRKYTVNMISEVTPTAGHIIMSVLTKVTGRDKSNMATTNRKYTNYYVYLNL